jgi:hypothetical protein
MMKKQTRLKSPRESTHAQTGPVVNPAESPIAWLRQRKDKDGAPMISNEQFVAGERLRSDFWFAAMTPRTTSNWSFAAPAGGRGRTPAGYGVEMRDNIAAAGERVRLALKAVGPELSSVLIDVCCHLNGLEVAERRAGWPQRSGKVILQLALTRLARHYGLLKSGAQTSAPGVAVRHWGAPDYRPRMDGLADEQVEGAVD